MLSCRKLASAIFAFIVAGFIWLPTAMAETLADIDAEIQGNRSIQTHRSGLDAYNIYDGVTNGRLDRKWAILQAAGVSSYFLTSNYANFYSFTGTAGVTDTKLDLVTTTATQRLFRRSAGAGSEIARGYFGAWWGDRYRGIQASRDEQAILAAWGSDLRRIYVIDVPAGYTLVGGIASPMEKNGEYRAGGAYQYYYSGNLATMRGWLVYALYAPDYTKSYAGAVTSAQAAGRGIAADLSRHLDQTRYSGYLPESPESRHQTGEFWIRGFGGTMNTLEGEGSSVRSLTSGVSLGWQRPTHDHTPGARQKSYFGVLLSQGQNSRQYGVSDYGGGQVETTTTTTVAGIYGLHVNRPESANAWYGQWSLLYGGINYRNVVPGEIAGAGLIQRYDGTIAILTLENGVSFRQKNGWLLEPQLQLSYTHIQQKDFRDNLGALIALRRGNSLWGRLGFEARRTMGRTPERKSCYWARISYSREFLARNEVDVAGDLGRSVANRDTFSAALGTILQLGRNVGLQAEAVQYFGGDKGAQAQLSVNYSW